MPAGQLHRGNPQVGFGWCLSLHQGNKLEQDPGFVVCMTVQEGWVSEKADEAYKTVTVKYLHGHTGAI